MNRLVNSDSAAGIWSRIASRLDGYVWDHYRLYPTRRQDGWQQLLRERIAAAAADPETHLAFAESELGLTLIALEARSWDYEHFGFPVGSIQVLFSDGSEGALRECLADVMSKCAEQKLKFASARIHGDQLGCIHALEALGFHYYENIIWPVVACGVETADCSHFGLRLMRPDDVQTVAGIAERHQYRRGHFHCDAGFPRDRADALYARWVRTAYQQNKPVLVAEDEGAPAGYFVLDLPDALSQALGARYGGMRSLGVNADVRGKGIGQRLFRGALAWLRDQGCEYVDSGYASKNHLSSKLHQRAGFQSVYEEVTLHRWFG